MEGARWWDEGWVQDFPPCVTGCLHVLPLWVILTMEVKERKCGGFLMWCGQDGNFEEALSPPIQWRARKREEALPNSSNASEPEPGGDEKHDLERDPSERMPPWKGRSKRKLSQEAAKIPTQGKRHNKNKRKTEGRQKQREKKEEKPNKSPTKPTTQKEPQTSKREALI